MRLAGTLVSVAVIAVAGTTSSYAQCAVQQVTKLYAQDTKPNAWFGYAVAVSGDTFVVGAPFDDLAATDAGAAYLFESPGGSPGGWGQLKRLSGNFQNSLFGFSVAMNGNTAVVGAPPEVAAFIFERNLGGANNWGSKQVTPSGCGLFCNYGAAVAIYRDTAIVTTSVNDAYVLERNSGGPGNWGETKIISKSGPNLSDFGNAMGLWRDTAVIGDRRSSTCAWKAGAAFVFERNQGGSSNWGEASALCSSTPDPDGQFGGAVALDGGTAVVGAYLEDRIGADEGAAYVFERDAGGPGGWGEVAKLTASDGVDLDEFGRAVAIQGDIVLVGAPGHDAGGVEDSGAVYVFHRNAGGHGAWGEVMKIVAPDASTDDEFGTALAIDGEVTVIGAPKDSDTGFEAGSVYVYEGRWTSETYCTAGTSASGCRAAIFGWGIPSATAATGFVLSAVGVEGDKDGLFFLGSNGKQANPWGNGTSYQCVVPPVRRSGLMAGSGTTGACDGAFTQDLNALWCPICPKPSYNPGPGAAVEVQLWYRDPLNSSNQTSSLSNALRLFVCP